MLPQQVIINFRKLYVYSLLLAVSALALVGGFFIEKYYQAGSGWVGEMLGRLVTEIGIAGFVGFLLALTFERLSADEFRKVAGEERNVIKQDVFHYVFGHGIPQEITAIIDKQILKTPLVRRNLRVEYILETIEPLGAPTKYVRAVRELSYDLENLTDHPRRLPVVSAVDVAPIPELSDEVKFLYIKAEGCAIPFEYSEEQLKGMQKESRTEKYIDLEEKILVLPDKTTHVTVRTQSVKHFHGGMLYLILNNHTCDLDLTVFVPGKDMDVVATATTDNEMMETHRHKPQYGVYNWRLERPLLAYQGVDVRWFPSKAYEELPPIQAVVQKLNGSPTPNGK